MDAERERERPPRLAGERLAGWWYDRRTGVAQPIGVIQKESRVRMTPPAGGPDWVLVLDDVSCGLPAPGMR